MKYHKVKDGEWVYPRMKGYKQACCDCGLVHKIEFAHRGASKTLAFRAWRDERATAAMRRKK